MIFHRYRRAYSARLKGKLRAAKLRQRYNPVKFCLWPAPVWPADSAFWRVSQHRCARRKATLGGYFANNTGFLRSKIGFVLPKRC